MHFRRAIDSLSASPRGCLVLAGLSVLIGVAFIAGWVPLSDTRRYLPGHEWFLAGLCWLFAAFLAYGARVGFLARGRLPGGQVR